MSSFSDNQHPQYPARTVMKIITDMPNSRRREQAKLESVFHDLLLSPKEWKHKSSRKQKYMSFTTTVYIQNSEQMQILYEKLKNLPEVIQVL
jgi:putative lipoic acid-binding regulatory protein